jgi:hypothetical protein
MGLIQKLNGRKPFAVVSDSTSPPPPTNTTPDGRERLRFADAECTKARECVADLEARQGRLTTIISDADAARTALQAAIKADGGVALEAYSAGDASDAPIARLVEHRDTTAKAASAAKDALPGVEEMLTKARAELVKLEGLKFDAVIVYLKTRAKDEHEVYVGAFNDLIRSYERLYGIAVALSVTGHSDMMTTALPVPIQAPGFNMGTGPAHGPSELVTMRHMVAEAKVGEATAKWMLARERLLSDADANLDDLTGMQFQYESDRHL